MSTLSFKEFPVHWICLNSQGARISCCVKKMSLQVHSENLQTKTFQSQLKCSKPNNFLLKNISYLFEKVPIIILVMYEKR